MSWVLDRLVPQLARPQGLLGQLVASLLNRGNAAINQAVVDTLEPRPGERVLEVGFGGGVGLAQLLARERNLTVTGIDASPDMVARCRRRFGERVRLQVGSVEALPYKDGDMDCIYGANVSYFWLDLELALAELRRVLRPGGRLVLGIRPPKTLRRLGFEQAGHRVWTAEQYLAALTESGFGEATVSPVAGWSEGQVLTAQRPGPG